MNNEHRPTPKQIQTRTNSKCKPKQKTKQVAASEYLEAFAQVNTQPPNPKLYNTRPLNPKPYNTQPLNPKPCDTQPNPTTLHP